MSSLNRPKSEKDGQKILARMGLTCIYPLKNARLSVLFPEGSYSPGENLEFDYLIPHNNICLIGEITECGSSNVAREYKRFRRHYNTIVREYTPSNSFWQELGVAEKHLDSFREITEFKGFFITPERQKFDVNLHGVSNIAIFYKSDWERLDEYSKCIGKWAKNFFLQVFGIAGGLSREALTIREEANSLIRMPNKKIAGGEFGLADIYTFEESPYKLLPIANVYRRDMLPDLAPASERKKYQRPLIQSKLVDIREKLLQ